MSRLRIVLGNSSLTHYPEGGGLWTLFLQYLLGLRDLGHDVFWVELFGSTGDTDRNQRLINIFFERMREYALQDRCILLLKPKNAGPAALETLTAYGRSLTEFRKIATSADLLWNFANAIKPPLLSLFTKRVLVDLDPGHLQVSALSWDMGQNDHDVFLSVGSKLRDTDCNVPALGLTWQPFLPVVYLPMWEPAPDPGLHAPFTSVTQWNWKEVWDDPTLSISKRSAYLRYIDLPERTQRSFELAANIHPNDQTGDRELLRSHGWNLADPHEIAGSPSKYQEYIRRSRAELSCPKPIFRHLMTGWLSDRSACYLASGRPVLAEDTGFGDHVPVGNGLVVFRNIEEALAGVAEIDGNYAHHSRAARELAERFFDSRRCLKEMLADCGA